MALEIPLGKPESRCGQAANDSLQLTLSPGSGTNLPVDPGGPFRGMSGRHPQPNGPFGTDQVGPRAKCLPSERNDRVGLFPSSMGFRLNGG